MRSAVLVLASRIPPHRRPGRFFFLVMIPASILSGVYLWNLLNLAFGYLNFSEDSRGYIAPALAWFNDGVFTHTGRGFVYPALLVPSLSGGSLNHVPVIQTFLFLAAVTIFYLAVSRSLRDIALCKGNTVLRLMAVVIPLCYFQNIYYALWVLPETLYQLFLVLTLFFLVLAVTSNGNTSPRSMIHCGIAVFFSSLNVHVKPHWAGAFLLTWIVVVLVVATGRSSVRAKAVALLIIGALSIVTAHYPNHHLSARYDHPDRQFGARTVFCNHLDLIAPIMEQFIRDPNVAAVLRKEIATTLATPSWWRTLGYYGDHCLYILNIPETITRELQLERRQESELLLRMFAAGVLHNPARYAGKILRQYKTAIMYPYTRALRRSRDMVNPDIFDELVASEAFRKTGLRAEFNHARAYHPLRVGSVDLSWIVRFPLRIMHEVSVLFLLAFMVLLIADARRRRLFSRKQGAGGLTAKWRLPLLGLAMYLASLSVVAAVHTFDIARYSQACSMLALYFHICTLSIVWARYRSIRRLLRYGKRVASK